jgi:hypothetical protein
MKAMAPQAPQGTGCCISAPFLSPDATFGFNTIVNRRGGKVEVEINLSLAKRSQIA